MNKFHKFPTSNKKNLQSNKNKPSLPTAPLSREGENKMKNKLKGHMVTKEKKERKKENVESCRMKELGNGKRKGEKIKEGWGQV